MQRVPKPRKKALLPEATLTTLDTLSQSSSTASGWGRLNAAAVIKQTGSGARRMHSQTSSNQSGHESWGDLLSGLVGTTTQSPRRLHEPEDISKYSVRFHPVCLATGTSALPHVKSSSAGQRGAVV